MREDGDVDVDVDLDVDLDVDVDVDVFLYNFRCVQPISTDRESELGLKLQQLWL